MRIRTVILTGVVVVAVAIAVVVASTDHHRYLVRVLDYNKAVVVQDGIPYLFTYGNHSYVNGTTELCVIPSSGRDPSTCFSVKDFDLTKEGVQELHFELMN